MERKLIAAAVSSALALPLAAQAVEFSVSGHVNRALMSVDGTGAASDGDWVHKDANSSESRVRFVGSEELESGMTVGVNLEVAFGGADQKSYDTADDSADLQVRHQNVYISTAGGKVTFGQTQTTSDNVPYANMGGPSWLAGVTNWCSYAGHGAACQRNSNGRQKVLRYDSPSIGPVSFAASTGNNDYFDTMVKIAGSMGDSGYDIRVGYVGDNDSGQDAVTAAGSISLGTGTAVTAAWGQNDDADTDYMYAAIDQSYGDGSIGAYLGQGTMGEAEDSLWGVGVGHNVGGGATAYAGYRRMEDGQNDVDLVVVGMRVTFN